MASNISGQRERGRRAKPTIAMALGSQTAAIEPV